MRKQAENDMRHADKMCSEQEATNTLFGDLQEGLEQAIEHARGAGEVRVTTISDEPLNEAAEETESEKS